MPWTHGNNSWRRLVDSAGDIIRTYVLPGGVYDILVPMGKASHVHITTLDSENRLSAASASPEFAGFWFCTMRVRVPFDCEEIIFWSRGGEVGHPIPTLVAMQVKPQEKEPAKLSGPEPDVPGNLCGSPLEVCVQQIGVEEDREPVSDDDGRGNLLPASTSG